MIYAMSLQTNEAKIRGYQKDALALTLKAVVAKHVKVTALSKLKCISYRMYTYLEVCDGQRYNRETLEVTYKGKNIAQVLDMTVEEATHFFENIPKIHRKLQTLVDVGLGYITLGQQATTLSGGEAQRVKLASELHKRSTDVRFIY